VKKPIKPTKYTASAGVYRDAQSLLHTKEKLEKFSFPYAVRSETGSYFLFVGSFYTFNGATEQCVELQAENIPCKAVRRGLDQ
jgi:hypothetical protein